MSAQIRQQYLQAMGIRCYVPRYVLPAARPSGQAEWVAANDTAAVAEADAPAPSQIEPAPAEMRSGTALIDQAARLLKEESRGSARHALDGLLGENESHKPKPVAPPKPSAAATASDDSPCRFTATIVDCGFGLRCVADTSKGPMSVPAKRLLANIARACHRELGAEAPLAMSAEEFVWPLLTIPGLQQGEVEARDALSARLARSETVPLRHVLILGSALRCYVSDDVLTEAGVTLIQGDDLDELMANPRSKARLWAQLRTCRFG
ncbi:hypothetical protein HCU74_02535 [Spongiibacter sp. KMU-166]|uniref:Uncharacterized protein n=1 Tax=Spongiibacter thalassae TaxID=2721624 RepID=A0ABX1GAV1_9GAMM|nr:hypothetical protein [Spongiibacter thalassae]NKI16289.1 hypothetical protein [Spongiibacter thalassae]